MDEYQENVQEVVDDEDQDDEDQEGVQQDIVDDDDTADKRFGKRLAAAKKRLAGAGKILADARSDLAAARSDLAAADKRLADAEAKEKEDRDEGYIKECRVYVNKCQQHVTTMQKFLEEAASKVCPSAKKLQLDAAYIAMVTCDGRFPALEYEVEHKLCTVSPAYADGTYLKFNGPLYFRKGLEKLFSFLETRVIAKNVVGWISGPPGSGKSTSSFAFAMTIDRSTWKVSYLCCSMIGASSFVHFKEDKKSKVLLTNAKDLDNILTRLSLQLKLSQRKHILFADGVCISKSTSQVVVELLRVCTIWYQNDTDHRRLVFISSMAGRSNFQTNFQEIEMEKFTLFSWTLDEYRSAIAVNGVWESIKDNAMADCHIYSSTSTADKAPTKDDLLVSKYHFAGGSCRFMFQKSTEQVILSIYDAIDKVSDFQSYVENNIGDCSVGVVNNLYGRYEGQESVIISAFALASIAIKRGPQLIKQIIDITNAKNNPSLHGQLLECWFFLSIRNGGIDLLDRNNNQTEHWDQCTAFIDLDPNTVILSPEPAWYRPIRWCQEGYDAVYVDPKKNLTRFVQVTKASSHSFNICYFYNLLQHFSEQNETKTLDICFLTPVDEMQNFKITPVYGEGLLHAFAGWKKGCEIQSARVLGAKDFRSFC